MTEFTEEHARHLSRLCRIEIADHELAGISSGIKGVLDYFSQLEEADVSDLPPYSHVDEQGIDSLREDYVRDHLSREIFLQNAPDRISGMVRVPPILKSS